MKSAPTVSIVLFSLLIINSITFLPQIGASDTSLFFFDYFDGEAVDSSKWMVEESTHSSGYPAYGAM